jgi:hypothetical protein
MHPMPSNSPIHEMKMFLDQFMQHVNKLPECLCWLDLNPKASHKENTIVLFYVHENKNRFPVCIVENITFELSLFEVKNGHSA